MLTLVDICFRIPIWPNWVAQQICKHTHKKIIAWRADSTDLTQCEDCHKIFSEGHVCPHPFFKLEVIKAEIEATECGGGTQSIPSIWQCGDCGHFFKKNMQCPICHTDMKIVGWVDSFSGRFYCSTCQTFYFREDLG